MTMTDPPDESQPAKPTLGELVRTEFAEAFSPPRIDWAKLLEQMAHRGASLAMLLLIGHFAFAKAKLPYSLSIGAAVVASLATLSAAGQFALSGPGPRRHSALGVLIVSLVVTVAALVVVRCVD